MQGSGATHKNFWRALKGWSMKSGNVYGFLMTIILSFIVLFVCDFLGDLNPLRIVCDEINQIVYHRGD